MVGWTNNYPGNTDTRYYWKLTRHIFRYSHGHVDDLREMHAIDERIRATTFVGMIKFYSMLILNGEPDRILPAITGLSRAYPYSRRVERAIDDRRIAGEVQVVPLNHKFLTESTSICPRLWCCPLDCINIVFRHQSVGFELTTT